jgi:hypothetical protein
VIKEATHRSKEGILERKINRIDADKINNRKICTWQQMNRKVEQERRGSLERSPSPSPIESCVITNIIPNLLNADTLEKIKRKQRRDR